MPPAVYRDMQYDNDGVCHNKQDGGKLHGNISQNGYGNAIIGRYGGCFEECIWWVYSTGESCAAQERLAIMEGEVRIIHGLNISQKNSCTCCKNLEVVKHQSTTHMLLGG